ncbi:MAG TPA: TetR/AcrR family transcriptional regulator, partial [Rhizomicrobium sp.]|nr:TetR/AcrR family transcriptional regulator [Rhizomicrobium sp.]
ARTRARRSALKPQSEHFALPVQQERSLATRERIVAAAEWAFAEKGYEGARIADIAARAGCSVGAVYFRFADKDALFLAIVEDFRTSVREKLPLLAVIPCATADEFLERYVALVFARFRDNRGLVRAIVEHGFANSQAMDMVIALRGEIQVVLQTRLESFVSADLSFPVRMMTQIVFGFVLTGLINARAPTRLDDARTVRELVVVLSAYLKEVQP